MNTVDIEVPTDVIEFLAELQNKCKDFDVYLGGGSLRDYYTGLRPKDFDIFFIPRDGVKREIPVSVAEGCYVQYSKDADNFSDMVERGVGYVTGARQYRFSPAEVQFIVYSKYLSEEELINDMDMGINQVMLKAGETSCKCSPNFTFDHESKIIKSYHQYSKDRMYFRYERMEAKFPNYKSIGKPEAPYKDPAKLAVGRSRNIGSV